MTVRCYECGDDVDPDDAAPKTVHGEHGPLTVYVCPDCPAGVFAGP